MGPQIVEKELSQKVMKDLRDSSVFLNLGEDIPENHLVRIVNTAVIEEKMTKIINEIQALENKRCNLIDLHLDDKIDRPTYERKYVELESLLNELLDERAKLEESAQNEVDVEKRITHFRQVLRSNAVQPTFDRKARIKKSLH